MKKIFTIIGILFAFNNSFAQKYYLPQDFIDSIQLLRGQYDFVLNQKNPSKLTTQKLVDNEYKALSILDSEPVKKIIDGGFYLYSKRPDLMRDLVYSYAILGDNKKAIDALKNYFKDGRTWSILSVQTDSITAGLKFDPDFYSVIEKFKQRLALWQGDAFKTTFKLDLSEDEKIAGLSLLWSQARANFVYFDKLDKDWNQTYMDFIPQVRATKTTGDYYLVLQKFYAQLHDGHSNVYFPKSLSTQFNSRPPIKTELIENRIFIIDVRSDSLLNLGIVPQSEIIKIDGIPIKEYADNFVRPYQSASTIQNLDYRTYTYFLLAGAKDKQVRLTLKDKKGKIREFEIARSGIKISRTIPPMEYKIVDGISYLTINNFESSKIIKQFDSLYTSIAETKGLIIDIRNNGGGNSGIGNSILGYLTNKKFALFQSKFVEYLSLGGEPIWHDNGIATAPPNKKNFYNKPVVMLTSACTFSAAEDFAVAFDAMKRGPIIGETTGGSTGQPISFELPGGGSARVCGKRETYPDGKEFVGIGIKPTIEAPKTIKDYMAGKDLAMAKAIDYIKRTKSIYVAPDISR